MRRTAATCRSIVIDPRDGSSYFTKSTGDILRYRYAEDAIETVAGKASTAKGESKGLENLHLITYHIPTARYADHGAIFFADGQRPNYVNSIAVGKDHKVSFRACTDFCVNGVGSCVQGDSPLFPHARRPARPHAHRPGLRGRPPPVEKRASARVVNPRYSP